MRVARVILPLLALLLLAVVGEAQTPVVTIGPPDPPGVILGPQDTKTVKWTVSNSDATGTTAADMDITVSGLTGWTLTVSPTSINDLQPGASRDVTVTIRPTDPDSTAPTDGGFRISATVRDQLGQTVGTVPSTEASAAYQAPPPPVQAPPPPAKDYTVPLSIGAAFLFLLLAGVTAYFVQSGGIRLAAEKSNVEAVNGTDAVFRVRVENRSRRPRDLQLRVREVPVGWVAALSYPVARLQPGESTTVPLLVKVPEEAPIGAVGRVRVEARPNDFSPWRTRVDVTTTVLSIGGGSGPAPLATPMPA